MFHGLILFQKIAGRARSKSKFLRKTALQLDFVDLHRSVVLTMAAANFILIRLLELQDDHFLGAVLLDDLARHGRLAGVRSMQNLVFPVVYRQNRAKGNLFTDLALYPLDANGVAGRDAILLSAGLDDCVHRSSEAKDKPQV